MILLEIATLKVLKKSKILFAVVLQWEARERIHALTFLPSNLTKYKKSKIISHIPVRLTPFSLGFLFPHCYFNTFIQLGIYLQLEINKPRWRNKEMTKQ